MLLEISNLKVSYGGALAVDGVSINVDQGEAVGVVGSNGAGKTSLFKAISGIVPVEGTITFNGEVISGQPADKIAALGLAHVPEGRRLFPRLSIEDNLQLGGMSTHKPDKSDFDRVYEMFPKLAERREQMAGTLSGGEQQMAAIGRALMSRPSILMLDEPSLGIAPILVENIYRQIKVLCDAGQTVLLAEQNVMECLEVCSRAYVFQTGRISSQGPSEELAASDEIRQAFLGV